ncbi:MAG TPA: hypothetical protein VJC15_00275 [Candidatus Paceibacterota bacterium]
MGKHYICTGGCEGISDKPGVCQTEGCADEGKPLKECNCEDGLHNGENSPPGREDEEAS